MGGVTNSIRLSKYVLTTIVFPAMDAAKRRRMLAAAWPIGVSAMDMSRVMHALRHAPELLDADVAAPRVVKDLAAELARIYKPVAMKVQLPLRNGTMFQWDLCNPALLFLQFYRDCEFFKNMFLKVAASKDLQQPWHLIVFHDEWTPGNVVKPDNLRKATSVYFSFLEFDLYLQHEWAWLPCGVLRHSVSQSCVGGLSRALRDLLRAFFLPDSEFNFTTGVVIETPNPTLFRAVLGVMIFDADALRVTWCAKGASGLKPCFLCKNVVMKDSELVENDATAYLVEISCSDTNLFDRCSDQDVWDMIDMLAAQKPVLSKTAFENLEKAVGFNDNPHGVLQAVDLREHVRPVKVNAYDSMHCEYAHGVATTEIDLFLCSIHDKAGVSWKHLADFCSADWRYRGKKQQAAEYFLRAAEKEFAFSSTFKGMASDVFAVVPLLHHFGETVLRVAMGDGMAKELDSFAAMAQVCYMLQDLKRHKVNAQLCEAFTVKQQQHLRLFIEAYGTDHVKPKHHFAMHLGEQMINHGCVVDAFALERKHQVFKMIATKTENTRCFERSVISRVLFNQLRQCPSFGFKLLGTSSPCPVRNCTGSCSHCFQTGAD